MRSLSLIALVSLVVANAQSQTAQSFVLNDSKPYVYIAFDHSGKRKPLGKSEDKQGFWLKFVNNCRVPVTLGTFETGTDDPGIGVFYDVVPFSASGIRGIPGPQEQAPLKAAAKPGEAISEPAAKPPEGYYAEVGSVTTVPPGESVLFSVPSNHLSSGWYLRVRFTVAVSPNRIGDQPYSYADFRWEQLPDALKALKK
jgi:hypothetical protein